MASDASNAFEDTEARSRSIGPGIVPRDRISLRDHVVSVEIGAFEQERGQTQRLRFDVTVEVPEPGTALGDDVDRVLSYDTITEAISAALAEDRVALLETLAERVAARILSEPRALRTYVRIEKLDRGPGALGVEIVRDADAKAEGVPPPPQPLIVALSNAALASCHLPGWIEQIAARGWAILCVGASDDPRPRADLAEAQRRIDLLAVEQAAWALAARDPRLGVVATRTEFDWALRHDHMSVWAPSKIVLDSTVGAPADPCDAGALAVWLAEQTDARRVLAIGADLPAGKVPGTRLALDDERLP